MKSIYSNLAQMKGTLTQEQYLKYVAMINLTANNQMTTNDTEGYFLRNKEKNIATNEYCKHLHAIKDAPLLTVFVERLHNRSFIFSMELVVRTDIRIIHLKNCPVLLEEGQKLAQTFENWM